MDFNDQITPVKGVQTINIRRGGLYQEQRVTRVNPESGLLETVVVPVPSGDIVKTVGGDNLALTALKTQLSHLIVGDSSTTRFVNRMCWGTGGHEPGDPTVPVAPSVGDTALETSILVKSLTSFNFPNSTSVLIYGYILEGEANGYSISESALLCGDNRIVARRTFGALAKTQEFVFEFKWLLAF